MNRRRNGMKERICALWTAEPHLTDAEVALRLECTLDYARNARQRYKLGGGVKWRVPKRNGSGTGADWCQVSLHLPKKVRAVLQQLARRHETNFAEEARNAIMRGLARDPIA